MMRLIVLCCVLASACANVRAQVGPGSDLGLLPNEGFLAVGVDTDAYLASLELEGQGEASSFRTVDFQPGRTVALMRLPADVYCLRSVITGQLAYQIRAPASCYEVKPGSVHYYGHFRFRRVDYGEGGRGIELADGKSFINLADEAQAEVARDHPGLLQRCPWRAEATPRVRMRVVHGPVD